MSTSNGSHAAEVPAQVAKRGRSVGKARTYTALFASLPGKATGLKITLPPDDATGESMSVSCPVGTEPETYDREGAYDLLAQCDKVSVAVACGIDGAARFSNSKRSPGQDVADAIADYL